jgi:hypothetical protein
MDWTWYLGFEGRINRAKSWLSFLILFGWMLFIGWMAYLSLLLLARAGYLEGEAVKISFEIDELFVLLGRASQLSIRIRRHLMDRESRRHDRVHVDLSCELDQAAARLRQERLVDLRPFLLHPVSSSICRIDLLP